MEDFRADLLEPVMALGLRTVQNDVQAEVVSTEQGAVSVSRGEVSGGPFGTTPTGTAPPFSPPFRWPRSPWEIRRSIVTDTSW